jgi:hypothetical protein
VGEAEDTVSVISQGRIIRDSKDLYERHALRLLAPIMEEAKCEHDLHRLQRFHVIGPVSRFILATNQP